MLEFAVLIFAIGSAIFFVGILFIGYRSLSIFELYIDKIEHVKMVGPEHSTQVTSVKTRKDEPRKVEELAPEVVAPNIKKPPRPPGGFGSKVS